MKSVGDAESGIIVSKPELVRDAAARVFQNLDK